MQTITVEQLREMQVNGEDFQLIDVREPFEFEIANLGGLLIPQAQILDRAEEIDTERPVVVHCRSGKRSETAIKILEQHKGHDNLINLEGGILAWADRIDPSVPKY